MVVPPVEGFDGSPAAAPVWPALRTSLLVLAAGFVLVAACAGWALRSVTASEPVSAPAPDRGVEVGPVALTVAGDWRPERAAAARVPGLDGSATATFGPAPGLRAYAIATVAPADHPSLLPAPLRALLPKPLAEPRRATLGGVPAWRYPELALSDGRRMEVTVAPSTAGVLTVACVAPGAAWVAVVGCASGVRGVSLREAAWLPPARDLAFRARLPRAVERLDRRRVAIRPRLRRAQTRRGQARLARRLGRAYGTAANAVAPSAPRSGPANRLVTELRRSSAANRLVTELRRSSAAHRRLAAAARANEPRRYRRARRAVKRGDAALARTLAGLR